MDRGIVDYRNWIRHNWIHLARRLPHPESYTHTSLPAKSDKTKVGIYCVYHYITLCVIYTPTKNSHINKKLFQRDREQWTTTARTEEDYSDVPTDQSAEASSDECDRLTDDLSSDSSV